MYEELGRESLSDRRWARRLTTLYKINSGHAPLYFSDHIPKRNEMSLKLGNRTDNTPLIRTERYENSFFPYTIKEWKKLNEESISKPSVPSFKKHLNEFIRPPGHSLFGIRDKFGINLLTKIRVSFSDLRDHRFNHNVKAPFARVVLKMKHLFIFFYAARVIPLNVLHFSAKYQT